MRSASILMQTVMDIEYYERTMQKMYEAKTIMEGLEDDIVEYIPPCLLIHAYAGNLHGSFLVHIFQGQL